MTTPKHFKRVGIAVVGGTVLVMGVALVVLPGPAFLAIPAWLAILTGEFAWARRWLRNASACLPEKRAPQPPRSGVLPGARGPWPASGESGGKPHATL